jgi:zinc protease
VKTIFLSILLLLTATTFSQNTTNVFPYDYSEKVLKNGLKVILIPMENTDIVAYFTVVRTGSRDEWEEGKSGFAHFFEHMMFRGTERFPGNVYDSIVTTLGADANAYTSLDLTVYHMKFASEDLETVMDIESDRFRNLKYSKEEFQTESGAIFGEYRKGRTSPWSVAYEAMQNMAFDKHTYKHTTIGFEKDIKDMPNLYDYSLSFYSRYYRPENCVLLIVGAIDVNNTFTLAEKYYSDWQKGYVSPKIEDEPAQKAPRKEEVNYEGKTLPLLYIGYKGENFDVTNKNYLAVRAFANIAFGETSELYKKLVLQEQKVQYLMANLSPTRAPYLFQIMSMVKNEKDIDYVIEEINKTIEHYKKNKVSEDIFKKLLKREKYSFLMSLDNPANVAGILPQYITISGGINIINEYFSMMEKITVSDIQNAVNYYFTPEKMNQIILKGEK